VPRGEPLLDLRLDLRESLRKPVPQALLAVAQRLAPSLGQAPLLLCVGRERVRSPSCECALEIGGTLGELLLDDGVELRPRPFDVALDRAGLGEPPPQGERPDDGG